MKPSFRKIGSTLTSIGSFTCHGLFGRNRCLQQKDQRHSSGNAVHHLSGNVAVLPYSAETLDYVIVFETVYFWSNEGPAFRKMKRVLKPNGALHSCCEADDPSDTTWMERIEGMTIHRGKDLKERLLREGYQKVELYHNGKDWMCLTVIRFRSTAVFKFVL